MASSPNLVECGSGDKKAKYFFHAPPRHVWRGEDNIVPKYGFPDLWRENDSAYKYGGVSFAIVGNDVSNHKVMIGKSKHKTCFCIPAGTNATEVLDDTTWVQDRPDHVMLVPTVAMPLAKLSVADCSRIADVFIPCPAIMKGGARGSDGSDDDSDSDIGEGWVEEVGVRVAMNRYDRRVCMHGLELLALAHGRHPDVSRDDKRRAQTAANDIMQGRLVWEDVLTGEAGVLIAMGYVYGHVLGMYNPDEPAVFLPEDSLRYELAMAVAVRCGCSMPVLTSQDKVDAAASRYWDTPPVTVVAYCSEDVPEVGKEEEGEGEGAKTIGSHAVEGLVIADAKPRIRRAMQLLVRHNTAKLNQFVKWAASDIGAAMKFADKSDEHDSTARGCRPDAAAVAPWLRVVECDGAVGKVVGGSQTLVLSNVPREVAVALHQQLEEETQAAKVVLAMGCVELAKQLKRDGKPVPSRMPTRLCMASITPASVPMKPRSSKRNIPLPARGATVRLWKVGTSVSSTRLWARAWWRGLCAVSHELYGSTPLARVLLLSGDDCLNFGRLGFKTKEYTDTTGYTAMSKYLDATLESWLEERGMVSGTAGYGVPPSETWAFAISWDAGSDSLVRDTATATLRRMTRHAWTEVGHRSVRAVQDVGYGQETIAQAAFAVMVALVGLHAGGIPGDDVGDPLATLRRVCTEQMRDVSTLDDIEAAFNPDSMVLSKALELLGNGHSAKSLGLASLPLWLTQLCMDAVRDC